MEKTISEEEKIRKAEEIYLRRRSGNTSTNRNIATVSVAEKKDFCLLKKMILQIIICLVIYFIYYLIQNSNYIFSEDVINKTKQILSYDVDLQSIYIKVTNTINNWSKGEQIQENNITSNEVNNETNNENSIEEKGIGGAEIENPITEISEGEEQNEPKEQNEIQLTDEEYVKQNVSFIKPVEGIVSSEFGERDVNNPIVSKNHTGIDIAANTGTKIKASMAGTVTISSTTGDYGYHIQITNGEISTLYAHCSKLYVKQGETIEQGQEIAEVGTTGKSTGPHLHFEIKKGDTYINPREIITF